MKTKKVKLILLGAAASVITGCMLFNSINVKAVSLDSVKQDVVYTQEDSGDDAEVISSGSSRLSESEDQVLKEKSKEALKQYFDLTDEDFDGFYYYSVVMNKNTLDDVDRISNEQLDEEYDNGNGDLTEEEYEKYKNQIVEKHKAASERLDKLKHGYIQTTWYSEDLKNMYNAFFNENTKEVEDAEAYRTKSESDSDEDLNLSQDERMSIAEKFIKDNKLAGIENLKFICRHGSVSYFEDENDASKKAAVTVNRKTGKVDAFYIGAFAEEIQKCIMESIAND